ncbi:hypothetical protein [Hydrogenophaga sp. 2FB]|uniref:hypothetical protein n=1 Tax=Hydrogenophaga sp. 2FB TaxID=2502187 RepID=UPI0010F59B86|nr:hypothetical protein [Hydrogenophaga sp. 2FB]
MESPISTTKLLNESHVARFLVWAEEGVLRGEISLDIGMGWRERRKTDRNALIMTSLACMAAKALWEEHPQLAHRLGLMSTMRRHDYVISPETAIKRGWFKDIEDLKNQVLDTLGKGRVVADIKEREPGAIIVRVEGATAPHTRRS